MEQNQAQWDPKKVTVFVIFIALLIAVPGILVYFYMNQGTYIPELPSISVDDFELGEEYNFIYGGSSGSISVSMMGVEEMGGYESELYEFNFLNKTYLGFGRYIMRNDTGVYITGYYELNESLWREPANVSVYSDLYIFDGLGNSITVYDIDGNFNRTLNLEMPLNNLYLDGGNIIAYDIVFNRYVWDSFNLELLEKRNPIPSEIYINIMTPPKPILLLPAEVGDTWNYMGLIVKSETEGYTTDFEVMSVASFHGHQALVVHEITDDHYYYFDEDGLLIGEKFNGIEFYGGANV
jgi:hypothetical protein